MATLSQILRKTTARHLRAQGAPAPPPDPPPDPPPPGEGVRLLSQGDLTYLGYYRVSKTLEGQLNYGQGFAHRYVDGQLRFLTTSYGGVSVGNRIVEFSCPASFGTRVTASTNVWARPAFSPVSGWGSSSAWINLTHDPDTGRTYTHRAIDYPSDAQINEKRGICSAILGAAGTSTSVKGPVGLETIGARGMYGGMRKVPAWFQAEYGVGPWVSGFGGYTSRMAQGGNVSLGLALYTHPDPASIADSAVIPAAQIKTLARHTSGTQSALDWYHLPAPATFDRGTRNPDVTNEYDNATGPFEWTSPAPDGRGRWVWGDSPYGCAWWLDTPTVHGFLVAMTLSSGRAWYQYATLNRQRYTHEFQVFDPDHLGEVKLGTRAQWNVKPTNYWAQAAPEGFSPTVVVQGNAPAKSYSGMTYDSTTRRLYLYATYGDNLDSTIMAYEVAE